MQEQEILDYYNENWNDYNLVLDMLHNIIDKHEEEVSNLKSQLSKKNTQDTVSQEVEELKKLLHDCQDKLDEETHKIS